MAISDLAAGGVEHGPYTPEQLYAGDAPIVSGHAAAAVDIDKYEVCVLTAAGLTNVFDFDGSGTIGTPGVVLPAQGSNCVIAAQAALTGGNCPYFSSGFFNHAMLVWPAALDTLAKRQAFFAGTPIQVGAITN